MKISQPKTARVINTARVLSQIRSTSSLSKAELSRILDLNKVSIGEIVDALIEQGLVKETGKIEVNNGRKPTCLELVSDAKYVLAVDIGRKNVTTALCNLEGKAIKIERLPIVADKSQEEFCVALLKSALRSTKLVEATKILGVGITIEGSVLEDNLTVAESFLPWKNLEIGQAFEKALGLKTVVVNSLSAYVSAEKIVDPSIRLEEKLLYVDWGHSIALAIVKNGKVVNTSSLFGHLKVANDGLCSCGEVGCLEAKCANTSNERLADIWNQLSEDVFVSMAKALRTANKITGINTVIFGGEAATITKEALEKLQVLCPTMVIKPSKLGDRAEVQAAAETALDHLLYLSSALDGMKDFL